MSKFLLTTASVFIIFAGLKLSQSLVAPFLLAVFFALVLMPPLRWLKRKGLSDAVAVFTLSSLVFLFGLGMILVFSSSLTNFAGKLPEYQKKTTAAITMLDDWLNTAADKFRQVEKNLPTLPAILEQTENETSTTVAVSQPEKKEKTFSLLSIVQLDTIMGYVKTSVAGLLNFATVSSLIAVLVIFMLFEAAQLPQKVQEAFAGQDLSNEYFKKIAADTWNYTKIKTVISFLTGAATAAGLWFLGVEYPLLWGILMFFLNYIPNIGQFIAGVPPVLLAFIDQGAGTAVAAAVWITIVNTFFGYGIEPKYLGEGLGISSLVVLISLVFWGWLLGPIGMFLSAPLTMVMKIVLQHIPSTRWLAVLLSNRADAAGC
ncbi:MAG: AI-2E family transporter [Planctomycetaceae bacterium]|jgi:predicted PurR-regulated permease PerM|nr:AI-2E family transporter [Planctomycetaceae bacterium]